MRKAVETFLENRIKGDRQIWFFVAVLVVISLLVVYSSATSLAVRYHGSVESYVLKHMGLTFVGLFLMVLCHTWDYRYYSRLSQWMLYLTVPLLVFTLFKGASVNEASRWIRIPLANLTFQTSDFAKLSLIMYVARFLAQRQGDIKDFKKAFLPIVLWIFVICGLIAPANLSTAAILFATCLLIMFIGRINMKYIASMIVIGLLFIFLVFSFGESIGMKRVATWKARITSFNDDKGESYHSMQANIAIASGGLLGKGPGNSTQRNFLPNAFSDFAYAIILEEYGIWGGIIVLMLYLMFLYRVIKLVIKSPKAFGALMAIGLGFSLTIQALINMAVSVGLFPVTGQTLPLISMGGTSLLFTSIALGIILSVSRDVEEKELAAKLEGNTIG